MKTSLSFVRFFFMLLCILFLTTYTTTALASGFTIANVIFGTLAGAAFGLLLIGADNLCKSYNLRTFNIALLGLFCGYLMGEMLLLIFKTVIDVSTILIAPQTTNLLRIAIFLFTTYLGMILALRASDEIQISIPFIKFKRTNQKKKDSLLDLSTLTDSRILDLASSGLLDNTLIIPRFLVKELNSLNDSNDEQQKIKARRSLESLKKLESFPYLELRFAENDFPEIKDVQGKLARLARLLDANIITADMSRIQQVQMEGVRIINIQLLANALKPLTQSGEILSIKIQRYGKEPRQGVGYLEDGTMVVVNGGAEYIGETIKSQVLSVKHTSSGRMIFCNAVENGIMNAQELEQTVADLENSHKNYFAI
jgi:uncharacterized protein YacL